MTACRVFPEVRETLRNPRGGGLPTSPGEVLEVEQAGVGSAGEESSGVESGGEESEGVESGGEESHGEESAEGRVESGGVGGQWCWRLR